MIEGQQVYFPIENSNQDGQLLCQVYTNFIEVNKVLSEAL